jgi:transcriptional regulator with XRE-family HTH domain
MKHVGRHLAESRRAMGLTQAEVAERLGTDQSRVSRIEHEENPRLDTLQSFARALDLELVLVPRRQLSAVRSLIESDAQRSRPAADRARFPTLDELVGDHRR